MISNLLRRARVVVPLALTLAGGIAANAQTYPDKPIKLVIPYAVGGSTDLTGRMLARSLSDRLGQPLVVESRPGAGGSVGHEFVAKSPADGYTLLFSAAGPLTVTPHIYSKLGYDPIKAFEPVTLVATQPLLLVLKPSLNAPSLADLVRMAKAQPGKLSYGSFGYGSAAHLAGEYFKMLAGVDIVHVPYKGSAPALTDLMAGQFDLMFDVFSTSAPLVEGGKLRAIAITSNERSPQFPDVPTMQQAGLEGFEAGTWFGLLVPTGTPRPIIDMLSAATNKSLAEKEVRENLASQGASVRGGTPEQFGQFFQAEYEKWQKIVKLAGITPN
ncbi:MULTISPECIES: tripartite tricarboxylate transporter substrate binding protein [unclassified Beijerinckia]|uniref:Bug family tripartite tricarboxylate transporter substrate binding protein n=1 Tax=unclassified Beijerinckia TaxID=2638183 RepID=UPI000898DABF|nr:MULTISPECIES: tripartite tricarboxylate transporter substrate binding protein [unclassified Beijerinckia]MDH7798711.1 tripartite-type tricarboxylate transporter receptor subunit TctC [Beijerinckia sp. GAS462]SED30411.1 Tripartite-type tricarboxylate transporter, receptor component TctC [Beijerinckia sp. 28-YEA-48]